MLFFKSSCRSSSRNSLRKSSWDCFRRSYRDSFRNFSKNFYEKYYMDGLRKPARGASINDIAFLAIFLLPLLPSSHSSRLPPSSKMLRCLWTLLQESIHGFLLENVSWFISTTSQGFVSENLILFVSKISLIFFRNFFRVSCKH